MSAGQEVGAKLNLQIRPRCVGHERGGTRSFATRKSGADAEMSLVPQLINAHEVLG
ncbi:hypothetical protein [Anaplasma marginale]|uniref:hypothetical protein n=1 Tax=Anaplasma marginale TaxID=770 RepID=UPI00030B5A1D|nr:hypothetical protein [Anaplasma marginale]